jgi:hypothetical protein
MYFLTKSSAIVFQWPAGVAVPGPSAQNSPLVLPARAAVRAGTDRLT